jgi:hypothetical protein
VNGGLRKRGDRGGGFRILSIFLPKKPKNMNLGNNRLNSGPIGIEIEGFGSSFLAQEEDFLRG